MVFEKLKSDPCVHECVDATTTHGIRRSVCVRCNHVSIESVEAGVTKGGVPSPRHEIDAAAPPR